jgi:uncharacterized protein (TIGR02453 family)
LPARALERLSQFRHRLPVPFTGFDRNAMAFWHELAMEMSREWFAANKERYERLWLAPMTALVEDVAARLAPVYAPRKLGPPRALRIYRDVRFAADKTPYKTHIAAVIRMAGKPIGQVGTSVLYVHLGLDEEYVGSGCWKFDAGKLARWRKVVPGKAGGELLAILAKLRKAGYAPHSDESYQRVPSGFAPDHPRAELLKMKGLTVPFPEIPAGLLHRPKLADWLYTHARATAPLVSWLHDHLG